jgi:hypothetical protein
VPPIAAAPPPPLPELPPLSNSAPPDATAASLFTVLVLGDLSLLEQAPTVTTNGTKPTQIPNRTRKSVSLVLVDVNRVPSHHPTIRVPHRTPR